MGVAPLSAWGISTFKTLGKAIWRPTIFSLVLLAATVALGVRQIPALIAFWLVFFAASITLYDYSRAVWARHKRAGENLPLALWHLAGRNRRRYGGYIIHLGVVMMALGVIGIELFQTETQGTIKPGESMNLAGYTVTFNNLATFDTADGRNVARAVIQVSKGGQVLTELHPRRDYYYQSQQPMTIPGVRSTMEDDLYVLLVDWQPISANGATFKIYHNPLVAWLWLGAFVFILGTMVAAWPDKDPEPARSRVPVRKEAASQAS
jgi:cytochrome c-type biogenesis protein CcmF